MWRRWTASFCLPTPHPPPPSPLQEGMLHGAKREMQRAEVQASIHPQRYIEAACCYAMLLYLHCRLGEAEEVTHGIKHVIDKVSHACIAQSVMVCVPTLPAPRLLVHRFCNPGPPCCSLMAPQSWPMSWSRSS